MVKADADECIQWCSVCFAIISDNTIYAVQPL